MSAIKSGDDVICIKTHSQGAVIKGKIYTVRDVVSFPCGCATIVDVGLRSNRPFTLCTHCGTHFEKGDNVWYIAIELFRKLLTDEQEDDLRAALEEVLIDTN
jgi:hypothetical protein